MLRMCFILLNRKDHKTSGRRKEVSSRGTWKHFAGLLFCCSGRSPKMKELPADCSYNRFCEMFICTLCTHLMLLWNIQVLINTLEHKRMIEMLLLCNCFFWHIVLSVMTTWKYQQIIKLSRSPRLEKPWKLIKAWTARNLVIVRIVFNSSWILIISVEYVLYFL